MIAGRFLFFQTAGLLTSMVGGIMLKARNPPVLVGESTQMLGIRRPLSESFHEWSWCALGVARMLRVGFFRQNVVVRDCDPALVLPQTGEGVR